MQCLPSTAKTGGLLVKFMFNFFKSKAITESILFVLNSLLRIFSIYIILVETLGTFWWYQSTTTFTLLNTAIIIATLSFFSFSLNKLIYSKLGLLISIVIILISIVSIGVQIADSNGKFNNVSEITWNEISLGVAWLILVLIKLLSGRSKSQENVNLL